MKKPTLTLMCGLPRSGKSSWLHRNKGDSVVVCPDVVRKEIFGHQFYTPAEGFIWAFVESMVKLLLIQKKDVVVDATSLTIGSRSRWISIGKQNGAKIRVVWVKASLKDVLKRNKRSPKDEQIPEDKLEMMSRIFMEPQEDEGIELIIYRPVHKERSNGVLRKKEKEVQTKASARKRC